MNSLVHIHVQMQIHCAQLVVMQKLDACGACRRMLKIGDSAYKRQHHVNSVNVNTYYCLKCVEVTQIHDTPVPNRQLAGEGRDPRVKGEPNHTHTSEVTNNENRDNKSPRAIPCSAREVDGIRLVSLPVRGDPRGSPGLPEQGVADCPEIEGSPRGDEDGARDREPQAGSNCILEVEHVSMMKIVTCNLPEPFISAMEKLIAEFGLYPSRSELIRVAVREFLIKELKVLDKFNEYSEANPEIDPVPKRVQNIDMRTIRNFHNLHSIKK